MRRILLLAAVLALLIVGWAVLSWQNSYRPVEIDLVEQFRQQDRNVNGKVGVLFIGLMIPHRMDDQPDLFLQIVAKPGRSWPWPVSLLFAKDYPTVLLDAARFHEREVFTPTRLVDAWGRDRDVNGRPYIDRHIAGELDWVAPRQRLGAGHFLDRSVRTTWPESAQKTTANARLWYYSVGLDPPGVPHEAQVRSLVAQATDELRSRHGALETRHVNGPIAGQVRTGVYELLDSGVETLILVSTQTIHSRFKDFDKGGGFYEAWRHAADWQRRNPRRQVSIIMADPIGHFAPMRTAYAELLKTRLDTLPAGTSVDVLLSSHGMPWDRFPNEVYPAVAEPYYTALAADVEALLAGYPFDRTRVSQGQDLYADAESDPGNKYTSTNEAYRAAAADGFDTILTLPATFYAENTDTLFGHALHAFDGLEGFEPFATIEHADWNVPLVREFRLGDTLVVYNGLPVGPHARHVATAMADAVSAIVRGSLPESSNLSE